MTRISGGIGLPDRVVCDFLGVVVRVQPPCEIKRLAVALDILAVLTGFGS